jgi:ribosome assembly protein YihI (activator of Der GTPase)
MSGKKKSRKVGLIGVRKDPDYKSKRKPADTTPKSVKNTKGRPAGSRHNVDAKGDTNTQQKQKKDPRIGSKKPVALIKTAEPIVTIKQRKFATPAEELAFIEADAKLIALLDKVDNGKALTKEQAEYVNTKTSRHQALCELMGIANEDDDDEVDPLDNLDAFKLDDFKD